MAMCIQKLSTKNLKRRGGEGVYTRPKRASQCFVGYTKYVIFECTCVPAQCLRSTLMFEDVCPARLYCPSTQPQRLSTRERTKQIIWQR